MFKHGKREPLLPLTFSLLNSHDFGIYDRPLPISADATASTSSSSGAASAGKQTRYWQGTIAIFGDSWRGKLYNPFAKSSRFLRSRASFGQFPRPTRSSFSPFPIAALRLTKIAHEQFCTRRNERKFAAFFQLQRRTALISKDCRGRRSELWLNPSLPRSFIAGCGGGFDRIKSDWELM